MMLCSPVQYQKSYSRDLPVWMAWIPQSYPTHAGAFGLDQTGHITAKNYGCTHDALQHNANLMNDQIMFIQGGAEYYALMWPTC